MGRADTSVPESIRMLVDAGKAAPDLVGVGGGLSESLRLLRRQVVETGTAAVDFTGEVGGLNRLTDSDARTRARITAGVESPFSLGFRARDTAAARAATEPVFARYTSDAAASLASGTAIVDFEDEDSDVLGLVTIGASWSFAVPVPGVYLTRAVLTGTLPAGWSRPNDWWSLLLYKNGGVVGRMGLIVGTQSQTVAVAGSTMVMAAPGDTLDVRYSHTSTGNKIAKSTTSTDNCCEILLASEIKSRV